MSAASPAVTDVEAASIAQSRARGLYRWNAVLAVLHAIQGLIILTISFARDPIVGTPIVSSYLTFNTALQALVPRSARSLSYRLGRPWRLSSS